MKNKYKRRLIMGIALFSAGFAIKNYALIGCGSAWIVLGIINKLKYKEEDNRTIQKYYIKSKRKIIRK